MASSKILTTLTGASPLNADDGSKLLFTADTDAEVIQRSLDNTSSDFITMETGLQWKVQWATNVIGDDSIGLSVRIMNSTTVLAAADSAGAYATVKATDGNHSTTDVEVVGTFGYTNTTADKATWDGAVVQLQQHRSQNMGADGLRLEVDIAFFDGTYQGVDAPTTAPTLTLDSKSYNQVDLSWTSVADADDYELQRSADGGLTWATIATTANLTYSDADVAAETTYDYRLRARNTGGNGPWSNTVTVTTDPLPAGVTVLPAPLLPNGDGVTKNWTNDAYTVVDEGVANADLAYMESGGGSITQFLMQDTPADFDSIFSLSYRGRSMVDTNMGQGTGTIDAVVKTSDGSVILAAADSAGADQAVYTAGTNDNDAVWVTHITEFAYINTNATKAQWDDAVISISGGVTEQGIALHVDAFELDGEYVAASTGTDHTSTLADDAGVSDVASRSSAQARSEDNAIALEDGVSKSTNRTIADDIGSSDDVAFDKKATRSLTDDAGTSDVVNRSSTQARSKEDVISLEDNVSRAAETTRTIVDDVSLADDTSAAPTINVTIADSLGIDDSTSSTLQHTASDALGLDDSTSHTSTFDKSLDESEPISDTVTAELNSSRAITESIGLDDDVSSVISQTRKIDEPVGIEDSSTRSSSTSRVHLDDAGLSDDISIVQSTAYNSTITDIFDIDDSLSQSQEANKILYDDASPTDSHTSGLAESESFEATDAVDVTDSIAIAINITIADSLSLDDAESHQGSISRALTDDAGSNDLVDYEHVTPGSIDVEISDSLTSTDDNSRSLIAERALVETVSPTDEIVQTSDVIREEQDSLNLSDSSTSSAHTDHQVTIEDSINATESVAQVADSTRVTGDDLALDDFTHSSKAIDTALTDELALNDNITQASDSTRTRDESVALEDSITAGEVTDYVIVLHDDFELTDEPRRAVDIAITTDDELTVSDSLVVSSAVIRGLVDEFIIQDHAFKGSSRIVALTDDLWLRDSAYDRRGEITISERRGVITATLTREDNTIGADVSPVRRSGGDVSSQVDKDQGTVSVDVSPHKHTGGDIGFSVDKG